MLTIESLRHLAGSMSANDFAEQVGPFALIQRPPEASHALGATLLKTEVAEEEKVSQNVLSLLFEFEGLMIATLPPLSSSDTLTVGRLPDSDLMIQDASVSKRHALLTWDGAQERCTLVDLGSTNGTLLNASVRLKGEVTLRDGDILSFGDVQFWYLKAQTLYEKLRSPGTINLGSRSG